MKMFTRLISVVVFTCFSLSNIAFASEINYFKLAPESKFSRLQGPEFKDVAQVQIAIREALKGTSVFDIGSIEALGERQFYENSVFTSRIAGTIYFNKARECSLQNKGVVIGDDSCLVKAVTKERSFYCLITGRTNGAGYDVSVVPDRVMAEALQSGIVKFTHGSIHENDRIIISKYTSHEITTANCGAIDPWISARIAKGRYAVSSTMVKDPLYKNAEQTFSPYCYISFLGAMRSFFDILGVPEVNSRHIIDTMKAMPLVILPYSSEEELPVISIDGREVRVKGHSSQFATYIFVPQAIYSHIDDNGAAGRAWREKGLEEKIVHEIGARCGLEAKVFSRGVDGHKTENILDKYFHIFDNGIRSGEYPIDLLREDADNNGDLDMLMSLQPVNLLELELRNDYAMGEIPESAKKSIFRRYMYPVFAALGLTAVGGIAAYKYYEGAANQEKNLPVSAEEAENIKKEKESPIATLLPLTPETERSDVAVKEEKVDIMETQDPTKVKASAEVKALIEILYDEKKDWVVRIEAAQALAKIGGEEASQTLIRAQKTMQDNWRVSLGVVRALGDLGDKRAVPDLLIRLMILDYWDKNNRSAVAEALGKIGDRRAVQPLLNSLDSYAGFSASGALIAIGDRSVVEPLVKMLESGKPPPYAARALAGFKDPRAFELISRYLGADKDEDNRAVVAEALGMLGDKRAVDLLIDRLQKDHADIFRVKAIIALRKFGDDRAIPVLLEILKKDTYSRVRLNAAVSLGELGDIKVMPALVEAMNDYDGSVKKAVKKAIENIDNAQKLKKLVSELLRKHSEGSEEIIKIGEPAIPYLAKSLSDENEDWAVRAAAADILGKIGGEKAFQCLLEAQKTIRDNNDVRDVIIRVLGDVGDERAVPDLIERLKTPEYMNEFKRWAAEDALVKIGGKTGTEKIVSALIKEMERSTIGSARFSIAETLGKMGSAKAIPALREAMKDKEDYVRKAAQEAIEKIEKLNAEKDKAKPVEKKSSQSGALEGRDLVKEVTDATFEKLWSGEAITVGDQAADARIDGAAMSILATLGVFAFPKPEDLDIHAIAARIKSLDVEVFMPRSQFPKETLRVFKDGLGRVFGDKLRVYDDLADLAAMIKDPQKTVVMTVDLSNEKVISARDSFNNLKSARFMNFEHANIEELIDQGVHENYIMDVLSKLLVARAITKEEANDTSSSYYRMMAHLLSNNLPKAEIDAYIRQIANDDMDPFIKILNLIKQILRAMPIERYKDGQLKSAVQVLWAA